MKGIQGGGVGDAVYARWRNRMEEKSGGQGKAWGAVRWGRGEAVRLVGGSAVSTGEGRKD